MHVFQERLQICVNQAGGFRCLSVRSGISAMQLKRYKHGVSNPTLKKLEAIALASGVKPSWLIGGTGASDKHYSQVVLDKDIFLQVVEQVEMTIMNQSKAFSPKRKALLIFALTKEVEKAEALQRKFLLSQQSILEIYDFMSIFTSDKDVEDIFRGIDFLPKEENSQKVKTWVDKICRIHTHACNTPSGKNYFDRLPEVNGQYGKELDWIIDKAEAMAGSAEKLLDIGCGNGRHLNYIHQHRPRLMLNGIDTSEYAIQLAKHRELRGDMPSGTFYQADMRHLPFPDNTFDIVISRFSLFCLPLSPTGEGGLHEVMREVARVLKPGGMMYGLTRRGKGISFYCLAQLLEREDVELLAHQTGLDVHGFHEFDINNTLHKGNEFNKIHSAISSCISFQLIKPLNWSKPE